MRQPWAKLAGTARPPFLLLTPACLLPACAAAWSCCQPLDATTLMIVIAGALTAHISVNVLNEYHDYRSGLDLNTVRTPFSGGSGTLPAYPELAPAALLLGISALLVTVLAGIWLLNNTGSLLLPFGIIGIAVVVLYSGWIVRHPLICLVSAGFGFGPLMLVGTGVALSGHLLTETLWAAAPVFFAVNNLLLLNQLPDVSADLAAGRRTLPAVAGPMASLRVYRLFSAAGITALILAAITDSLPWISVLAIIPLSAGFAVAHGMQTAVHDNKTMTPYLAVNVAICLLVPVLLTAGLVVK